MTDKETMQIAMAALKELVAQTECRFFAIKHDHFAMQDARSAIRRLEEALANHIPDDTKMVSGVKDSLTTQQEQGDLESGFFSREAMAAHSDGHVHLKQEQGEPVAFEEWLSKQHGDPEEIGFLQALRIAYISWQDSITTPQQRTWVGLNWDDLPEIYVGDIAFLHGAKWAEAKLKEKNT